MTRLARLVVLALALARAEAAGTLYFSAIPDEDETQLEQRFTRVAAYLRERLGNDVQYIPVKDYAAVVTAFQNDQVQLAWFGGLSGVRARARVPGSEAIAQGVEDTAFRTYFIAHASTGLEPGHALPEAVRGRSLTFGSKGSTSGRLMPEYYIRVRFQAPPEEVFSRVGFSGNHSRTIALVSSGAYEVGAVNFKVWEKEHADGQIDPAKVQVIWVTPPYPDYQWTIRGDVDARWGAGFKETVRRALLEMDDPALLESFPRSGFIPASNADYEPIVETARAIGLID